MNVTLNSTLVAACTEEYDPVWLLVIIVFSLVSAVIKCAKNVMKGNVPLTDSQKTTLRRKKNDLRALSVKKTSLRNRRKIIQKGGFLKTLLPPVLSVLASLLMK